ncbi:LysE family translocator [Corallococcus macrosporus]|uniref:LysE family translocator n=1 Tax=Corallococcus macrosporus TaxID=35 RepID=UPI001A8C95CC|nr:LysE family translocator [Corallococcus macrosporus]
MIVAFWGVSLLFVITPGADWAFAITAGLRDRSVAPAVGGLMLGHFGMTLIVAAGVGTVVSEYPVVLTVLTMVGAAYLVRLGLAALKSPGIPEESKDAPPSAPWWARLLKGAGVSGTNPKVFLLFLALLPQFTIPDGNWSLSRQMAVLGLVHTLSCGAVYLCVGVAARAVLKARPVVARAVTRTSGVAMTVIGTLMLIERLAQR